MDAGLTARGQAGFTLMELVATVAVLSILAVGVGLGTGVAAPPAERDADRFRRAYAQAWATAVLGREARGLTVSGGGLVLWRPGTDGWQQDGRPHDWRSRVTLRAAPVPPGTPEIVIRADGHAPRIEALFGTGASARRCVGDGWDQVTCRAR